MNLVTIGPSLSCQFFRKYANGLLLIKLFLTLCQIRGYLHDKVIDAILSAIDEKKITAVFYLIWARLSIQQNMAFGR